ncbi:MAG: hypothetical protein AMJ95_01610 [Omnitrophica WOR_2 bacterium SM23_72]|nr:MAG: hypothetical protein AMJ95_01610 [Omnitrophica WOR_2 bacterium SM23_72]
MKKGFIAIMGLTLLLCVVSTALAGDTQYVDVQAYVPQQNGLSVTVSKVVGTTFTPASSINFGTLVFDPTDKIFRTSDGSYYAVDVGCNSNADTWTITHAITSLANGTSNLNYNVNVTFMKQTSGTQGTQIGDILSYAGSNGKTFTKSQLSGGWLRVYYGLATGVAGKDASDVTPVPATKTYGAYSGRVTFTLTP